MSHVWDGSDHDHDDVTVELPIGEGPEQRVYTFTPREGVALARSLLRSVAADTWAGVTMPSVEGFERLHGTGEPKRETAVNATCSRHVWIDGHMWTSRPEYALRYDLSMAERQCEYIPNATVEKVTT